MSAPSDPEQIAALLLAKYLPNGAPERAAAQLADLARLVEAWGSRMNLSGHRSAVSICEVLIGEAIGALAQIETAMGEEVSGRVVDLGSGAGFPGLPIAIVRPRSEVFLVEVREKRHLFQRAARRHLGLENAHPIRARIEDVETEPGDLVLAQAVGPIEQVVEWMRPYLAPGSLAAIPGGAELESPPRVEDLDPRMIDYRSPIIDQPRRIWLGRCPES